MAFSLLSLYHYLPMIYSHLVFDADKSTLGLTLVKYTHE
jgi:hypothetical protein